MITASLLTRCTKAQVWPCVKWRMTDAIPRDGVLEASWRVLGLGLGLGSQVLGLGLGICGLDSKSVHY